jgi:hypothetical protein
MIEVRRDERGKRVTYPRKATGSMIILPIPNLPHPLLGFMGSSSVIVQIWLIISYVFERMD